MHFLKIITTAFTLFTTTLSLRSGSPRMAKLQQRYGHTYCTPPDRFTIGYSICTFASIISPTSTARLWIFDSLYNVIGEAKNIHVTSLHPSAVPKAKQYDFDSKLKSVAVTDLKDDSTPVVVEYAGKTWGGKEQPCWRDGDGWWNCSFNFDAEPDEC